MPDQPAEAEALQPERPALNQILLEEQERGRGKAPQLEE
jgi:hypothetical protein